MITSISKVSQFGFRFKKDDVKKVISCQFQNQEKLCPISQGSLDTPLDNQTKLPHFDNSFFEFQFTLATSRTRTHIGARMYSCIYIQKYSFYICTLENLIN